MTGDKCVKYSDADQKFALRRNLEKQILVLFNKWVARAREAAGLGQDPGPAFRLAGAQHCGAPAFEGSPDPELVSFWSRNAFRLQATGKSQVCLP